MNSTSNSLSSTRQTAVVSGHLCAIASAYLFARAPLLVFLALFAAGILLVWVGHGSLRGPALTRRERIVLFGGLLVFLLTFWPARYWEAARASMWLPRQPAFVWLAACGAIFDLSRPPRSRRA